MDTAIATTRLAKLFDVNRWLNYWEEQQSVYDDLLAPLLEIFVCRAKPILSWRPDDMVLDIGCGPGELARLLKNQVREIYGVDISKNYIRRARQRFAGDSNIHFHELDPERYTDLSFLQPHRFSLIVCHSVVQYYGSPQHLRSLILHVSQIASPGARLLIADIPSGASRLREAGQLMLAGLKGGYLTRVLKTFSSVAYYRARGSGGLWNLDDETFHDCAEAAGADVEFVKQPLTVFRSRRNVVFQFSE